MDNLDKGVDRKPGLGSGIKRRGFASMSAERQLEIARRGGRAVPSEKRSFSTNSDLAREAGRKGGSAKLKNQKGDA
jgi:general stress protein YciG